MSFLRALTSQVLLVAVMLCAVPVVGFWARDVHWFADFASHFLLPSVLAACVVSILAGLLQRGLTGAAALGVAIAASLGPGTWTSQPNPVPENLARFKVLQFNVWYRNGEPARMVEAIRSSGADLVVLLEATPRLRAALDGLADVYPSRLACPDGDPCDIVVLARGPLAFERLSRTSDRNRSPVLSFRTTLADCPLTVHAVHLARPFPFSAHDMQPGQARDVASAIARTVGPRIVVGDFNAAPWGQVMQTITTRAGVSLLGGPGGTWPVRLPQQMRIPIDHVAAGQGLAPVRRQVLAPAGSDHAPVLATIAVTDPSSCGKQ